MAHRIEVPGQDNMSVRGHRPRYVLFPGRHHMLTRFQADYLRLLVDGGDSTVIWAVASANHQNTKRNPVPYHRREAAIERFSVATGLRSIVIPVFDIATAERLAEVTLKTVTFATGLHLTPVDTVVACSTTWVAALYERLGFQIAAVESDVDSKELPERPWDVLLRLASGDETWRELAHPATTDIFDRYGLTETVQTVTNDPVVDDEGDLTPTRDYRTYVDAFADAAGRKWTAVRPYVQSGRIVDIGCGAGALLEMADQEPALCESDLIGVELARHLYQECMHKKAQGTFSNANVYFYQRNILDGPIFPDSSVNTTLTLAVSHEIWSYGAQLTSLLKLARRIYDHTVPGGVWINSDVCGPGERDRPVILRLLYADGENPATSRHDLTELSAAEVAHYIGGLSTRARLEQFAADFAFPFKHEPIDEFGAVQIEFGHAMEYLTHKDYIDNWLSETREQFCGLNLGDWIELLTAVGFEIEKSSATRNDWLIEHRIDPVASLQDLDGRPIDWPSTHILCVARRPRS